MKKIILTLLLCFSVFLTGCPKAEKSFRKARESSAKMAIYGEKIVQANIDARNAGEISQDLFRDLTSLTARYRDGLRIYREALTEAEKLAKSPAFDQKDALNKLSRLFDEQVVDAFLALTQKLNLISGSQSETIKTILASIRLTILAIQGAFSQAGVRLSEANV